MTIGLRRLGADPGATGPALTLLSQVWIVGVEDGVVRAFEQAALDRSIGLHRAVPFQMVRGEGGPNADSGADALGGFDLIAAEFHHQPVGGGGVLLLEVEGHFGGGHPHVSAHGSGQSGLAEHVAQQVGDGGFAVGSGDAHPGDVLQGIPGHRHLSIHGNTALA